MISTMPFLKINILFNSDAKVDTPLAKGDALSILPNVFILSSKNLTSSSVFGL